MCGFAQGFSAGSGSGRVGLDPYPCLYLVLYRRLQACASSNKIHCVMSPSTESVFGVRGPKSCKAFIRGPTRRRYGNPREETEETSLLSIEAGTFEPHLLIYVTVPSS